jgi:hypothetical protein
MKGLQKGRLTPGCYVGRTKCDVRAKGQHRLDIGSSGTCFITLTRRLRVGELAEPLCSNHDNKYGSNVLLDPISLICI